jgi:phytol kinase
MNLLVAIVVTFLLLMSTEILWRKGHVQKEYARKLVHMSVGVFVAFWPFFLDWNQIRLLSIAFIVAISLSLRFKLFKSIHSVERPSWGEVLFALSVGLVTFLTTDPYIYAAAILHMSLADGAAAIIGTRYGAAQHYYVLGQYKSLIGSLAFLTTSIVVLTWYVVAGGANVSIIAALAIGVVATALENAGWRGFDNVTVPVFVAAILSVLR